MGKQISAETVAWLQRLQTLGGTSLNRTALGPKMSGLEGDPVLQRLENNGKISLGDQKLLPLYKEFQYTHGPV